MDAVIKWCEEHSALVSIICAVFTPIAVSIITYFGNRSSRAAREALALKDATIEHLRMQAKSYAALEAEHKAHQRQANIEKQAAQNAIAALNGTIDTLHETISNLKEHIREHPQLVAWGATAYKYAFPETGKEATYFCAECWNKDRILTALTHNRHSSGRLGFCSRHNQYL